MQLLQQLQSVVVRHVVVEQNHIRNLAIPAQQGICRGKCADHVMAAFLREQQSEGLAKNIVIVHYG